ncbi:MAG: hypothetical protein LC655_01160 [Bacteroidales bacterium]|nr:hypothetical protein [Bacteroidales bacterium]
MTGKIIGVGFQKTGTSTLREALKILGYTVKDTTPRALVPILRGNYTKVLRIIKNYDALEDTPWYLIYKELDQLLPGSKFILTIRDEKSWYSSVSKHVGDLPAAHHEWIYGRGKGLVKYHRDNTIDVYRQHNKEVIEYFRNRQDDLLVLDFTKGDRWEPLCMFLGKEIPDIPFPHYNKTSDAEKRRRGLRHSFRMLRHRIKNRTKIWYIDAMGWWNTSA